MFEKIVIRRVAPKKKSKVWITLKGVNSNSLDPNHDPGQDGNGLSANHLVARDVMGFSLHYYDGDYGAINGNNTAYGNQDGSDMATHSYDLFNGNIGRMVTTITDPDSREALPMGNAYKYDQLNRLREARSFTNYDASSNAWGSGQAALYYNAFTFDANGNIETQERWNAANQKIDQLEYKYKKNSADKLLRNRLYSVIDLVDPTLFTDDIDDMNFIAGNTIETANNYIYDQEGRLIEDKAEKISLTWRSDGKVKTVKQSDNKMGEYSLSFDYDAMGRRIAKHSYDKDPTYNNGLGQLVKSTYYILDALGNTISVYEREINNTASTITFTQEEKHIYGASRLGVMKDSIPLLGSQNDTYDQSTWVHTIGKRMYELSNHLGNVLSVISDKVIPHQNGSTIDYFLADIRQSTDYSPFGVTLQGRNITVSGLGNYRFGFQGQEMDDEMKGESNSVNYTFRMHDSRLGRFFAIDPLASDYPYYSTYSFSGNRLIDSRELEGLEPSKSGEKLGETAMAQEGNTKRVYTYTWTQTMHNKQEWVKGAEYAQATPEEAAQISEHVYNLDKPNYDPGKKTGEKKLNGYTLVSECITPGTGFKAGLYKKTIDGVNFYVHATAGTDDLMDGIEDLGAGTDWGDVQIAQSLLYAAGTDAVFDKDKNARSLTYVGHSLGGGLAASNAMKYNHQAITFNAMGVSAKWISLYKMKNKPKINAYIIKGEILNAAQITKANGTQHIIQPKGTKIYSFNEYIKANGIDLTIYNSGYYLNFVYPKYVLSKSADNHSMSNFLNYDF